MKYTGEGGMEARRENIRERLQDEVKIKEVKIEVAGSRRIHGRRG